jgi:sigma-B regulation protein RsbU (phosphoserine phosphatase)
VCRAIKAHPDTEDTVIIFLSARGEVADKVSGLQLGAVDYITKPIQAEEVLARVDAHLTRQYLERELRRSRDRLERELASAASMQRLILPATLPVHPSARFAAYYQTSRHAGGDYYDILELGDGRFGIIVADVSGHGARAAIVMAMIRAVIHTFPGTPDDPAAVLHYLNRHFRYLWETAMFATGLYGVLDVGRGTLRLACAGHPAPLRLHRDGRVEELSIDGVMALLWDEFTHVPCSEHALEAGDRVVFYTDGITDRLSQDGTLYDIERLMSALGREGSRLPGAIVERIVVDLDTFAGGHEPDDDQTLLVVGID